MGYNLRLKSKSGGFDYRSTLNLYAMDTLPVLEPEVEGHGFWDKRAGSRGILMRQMWLLGQSLQLVPVRNSEAAQDMEFHYSQPKGFVGRNIVYSIIYGDTCYGTIAGGSATRFLPNRDIVGTLNNGVNNIFFHIEKRNGKYPFRNFVAAVLKLYRSTVERDWKTKYGDDVTWHETLVEPPRTGECYRRDGWNLVGQTQGFTCKRIAGNGSDSWGGKRVWDTKNLRPKLVFVRRVKSEIKKKHIEIIEKVFNERLCEITGLKGKLCTLSST